MLKNFLYLNESALADYLSALEGGARASIEDRNQRSGGANGRAANDPDRANSRYSRENEQTVRLTDTPPAQFERLMALTAANPQLSGWIEVTDPEIDFPDLRVGALIDVECDIQIPSMIKALSPSGGVVAAVRALNELGSKIGSESAQQLDTTKLSVFEALGNLMGDDLVVVGEPDSDQWTVAGKLRKDSVRVATDELDGSVRIVGKVSRRLAAGDHKPLLALPGLDILPRAQRREIESKGPSGPNDDSWVKGPALLLEVLAIYR